MLIKSLLMKGEDPAGNIPMSFSLVILSLLQLHVTIRKTSVKVVLDCSAVGEKSVNAAGNITTDGVEILGRMVRSRGRRDSSAPVSINFCLGHC